MSINYIEIIDKFYPDKGVTCNGDSSDYGCILWDDTPISKQELDAKYIELLKNRKNEEIDIRTVELIKLGFSYDGEIFSLSEPAQINWIGIKQASDAGLISFPFPVTTSSDGKYELQDANDVTTFYLTGLGAKKTYLDSGRALKTLINAATTEQEIANIEDNR